jgi:medium-chain acyl-[acyl-carrier-protein] hydrolase
MVPRPRPEARLRMVCFPHAGAGGSAYRRWPAALPDWLEVAVVSLPGREARIGEPAISDLRDLLPRLLDGLGDRLGEHPFVLLGHSMGALIGFELAGALAARGGPLPRAVVVSGRRAPHLRRAPLDVSRMTTEALVNLVQGYGGMPPELLSHPEILEMFMPTLRADICLVEGYRYRPGPPLAVPIIAYGGNQDSQATEAEIRGWARHTGGSFGCRMFDGGHFFLYESADACSRLAEDMAAVAVA